MIKKQVCFVYAVENNVQANVEMKLGALLFQRIFSSTQ